MKKFSLAVLPALLLIGCGGNVDATGAAELDEYTATLVATEGNSAQGTLTFSRVADGIAVRGEIEGLTPGQTHGFHIHQYGDCSAADGTSAGGHFNPTGSRHGGPDHEERHVGDLGNIVADDNGLAQISFVDSHLAMDGSHSILGRGVIIHANADDLESQPTGDAGGRISCGVIGIAE